MASAVHASVHIEDASDHPDEQFRVEHLNGDTFIIKLIPYECTAFLSRQGLMRLHAKLEEFLKD